MYSELIEGRQKLEKENEELQDYAQQKHEMSVAIADPKRIEALESEEQVLQDQVSQLQEGWMSLKKELENEIDIKKDSLNQTKVHSPNCIFNLKIGGIHI